MRRTLVSLWAVLSIGCNDLPEDGSALLSAPFKPAATAPAVWLAVHPDAEPALDIRYERKADAAGARVVELIVRFDRGLEYLGAEPGAAAIEADKQVVAQARDDHTVRIVIFSPGNVAPIPAGTLASLRFARTGKGGESVRILTDKPLLAPAEANTNLKVGGAVEL
jgi:hypothetical protein